MLQRYSVRLRINSWFMKYLPPQIGVCGRHRCFPGGDAGRRQQCVDQKSVNRHPPIRDRARTPEGEWLSEIASLIGRTCLGPGAYGSHTITRVTSHGASGDYLYDLLQAALVPACHTTCILCSIS